MNSNKRDIWVDNVKVVACILVALGHFLQSMVRSNILVDSFAYNWFDDAIYCFHVPLFFICSGYLYQKYSCVNSFALWMNSAKKKLIALGVPYFVFSLTTWILKNVFSSSVNRQNKGDLLDTLFKSPASPYWYLYVLFFIFLITATTSSLKQQLILLVISLIAKLIEIFNIFSTGFYFIDKTFSEWIWFVLGMTLAYKVIKLARASIGIGLFGLFVLGSYFAECRSLYDSIWKFILAILACYSVISIIHALFDGKSQNKFLGFLAKYTMPIFLMHTIFAAPFRSVLLKLGVYNFAVHFIFGLFISFVGPIIAMIALEKIKPLDFVIYPGRYIKFNGRK